MMQDKIPGDSKAKTVQCCKYKTILLSGRIKRITSHTYFVWSPLLWSKEVREWMAVEKKPTIAI